ncbi:hypothetical protein LY76DRAFT_599426 [Colletotrichum caudatum]|nr:hypothetical protein LY76DRAFT_599426 [Colletotrichum caudatum]
MGVSTRKTVWLLLLLLLQHTFTLVSTQHVFINQVQPDYDNLAPCAEEPLSKIVRGMVSGCGDGGKTTSHSCFCTASPSFFASVISTDVVAQCTEHAEELASTAVGVFQSYCALQPSNSIGNSPATSLATPLQPTDSRPGLPATRKPSLPIPSSNDARFFKPSGWIVLSLLLVLAAGIY